MLLAGAFFTLNSGALEASVLMPRNKKVSTPSAIRYIKTKTPRVPTGPAVDGVVVDSKKNSMMAAMSVVAVIARFNISPPKGIIAKF